MMFGYSDVSNGNLVWSFEANQNNVDADVIATGLPINLRYMRIIGQFKTGTAVTMSSLGIQCGSNGQIDTGNNYHYIAKINQSDGVSQVGTAATKQGFMRFYYGIVGASASSRSFMTFAMLIPRPGSTTTYKNFNMHSGIVLGNRTDAVHADYAIGQWASFKPIDTIRFFDLTAGRTLGFGTKIYIYGHPF